MKKILSLICFIPLFCCSQQLLKPSIGLFNPPADNESVCAIPFYLGNFSNSGLQAGDTAFDFKLFNLSGDSFVLSEKLSQGKPVLLVAGSYTCPVFRNKLSALNSIASTYSSQIEIAIIYTVEAHPIDTSPYFGYVNITQANQNQGILYRQPTTYGERKAICSNLLQSAMVEVPVFIDGPCNQWWSVYGPAPNNAYLIDTNGMVFSKHDWFDRHPEHDIVCDIDSLLGIGGCNTPAASGAFVLQPISTTVTGVAGEVLYAHVNVINTTSSFVNILVKKIQPNIPAGWETAFCYQVCFSASEDSVVIQVAPNDTADLSVDFFTTSPIPDSGSIKVGFRNTDNSSNAYTLTFRAWTTEEILSVNELEESDFLMFPNPSSGNDLQVVLGKQNTKEMIGLFDSKGNLIYRESISTPAISLPTSQLGSGVYFVRVGKFSRKWVKE